MKKFIISLAVIVLAFGGLRLFALASDNRKPKDAGQVYAEMDRQIKLVGIVKSPKADRFDPSMTNLTMHIFPPEGTPPPTPTPHK